MRIESTSRFTQSLCGKVGRVEENRSSCFYQDRINNLDFETKVIMQQNQVCYYVALNRECPDMVGLTQINATISIQYNDTEQTYVYDPTDASTSFSIVNQAVNQDYYKYCFQDPKSLRYMAKRMPYNASIVINVEQFGTQLQMTGFTKRVQIEDTSSDGFYHTTASIQVVEIQLYGLISATEALKYTNIINSITDPVYYVYMSVYSKKTNFSLQTYQNQSFNFANNSVQYMARFKNPGLPDMITQMVDTEDLADLVVHWTLLVSDRDLNVHIAHRRQFDRVMVTCWSNVSSFGTRTRKYQFTQNWLKI
ncbi:Hypothetical_protein [Hexamita inflata]|uniref:Hypothetical_protein n=1 Tax=Hexamita inflata TaxID=28002 RepID=A0ABP1HUF9_9EUKA